MKRRLLTLGILGTCAGAVGLLAACADASSEAPLAPSPEAGTVVPSTDGGDVASDADVDVDDGAVDAAPRTCSDQNFCHTDVPEGQVLRGVWGDGAGAVWAVSEGGNILRWDGAAWVVHASNAGARYFTIWGSGPTDIWVGGTTGLLHGTGASPSSLVFAPVEAPGDATIGISSIWGTGPDDVWAVGGAESEQYTYPRWMKGRVLHFTAGAWTLDEATSAKPIAFSRVWGTPQSGVWIAGNSFYLTYPDNIYSATSILGLVRRAPGGSTFEAYDLTTPPTVGGGAASLETANMGADGSIWLFGRSSNSTLGAWHGTSADNGQTFAWTFESRKIDFALSAIWGNPGGGTWAVGAYGRVRRWDGTAWSQAALAVSRYPEVSQFHGVWGTSDDDLWVVGDNIALHKKPASIPK